MYCTCGLIIRGSGWGILVSDFFTYFILINDFWPQINNVQQFLGLKLNNFLPQKQGSKKCLQMKHTLKCNNFKK